MGPSQEVIDLIETAEKEGIPLNGVDFSGENLVGLDLSRRIIFNCNFIESDISWSNFYGSVVKNCKMDGAKTTGSNFEKVKCKATSFKNISDNGILEQIQVFA